ncbi:tRNA(adenine34) deaminase [Kribbella sp. VKM Ac-2527]|uniref:tRNA(Adenine34) deaminase n=1 Tax=Kribbella caucasensis TaxID=2512215 RepID=A0A4R6IX75_9ACTN|nr:nucleoside deaminase [Kribbella sp. VKM Ac-2527]TDO27349.1 tRNA(adenine34) deaminase [Kribbella sp. VKM Ac-2527]
MEPEQLVSMAIEAAEEGLSAGELPIGAVLVSGGEVIGRSFTQEKAQARRLVHAELLAMNAVDRQWGWDERPGPLVLATTLEPCLMCLGAAMTMCVSEIYYALASPGDGASGVAAKWQPAAPDTPFSRLPKLMGGLLSDQVRTLFARYAETATGEGARQWARGLAEQPT